MQNCMKPFRPFCLYLFVACTSPTLAFLPFPVAGAEFPGFGESADNTLANTLGTPGFNGVVPVDTAFALSSFLDTDNNAVLVWEILDGHYLYRDKLRVTTLEGEEFPIQLPQAQTVTDEFFGESAVYFDRLVVNVSLAGATDTNPDSINLVLHFQGCATDRYCYPPQQKLLRLDLP
jgi:thiol:disulfide interchange protein